MRTAILCLERVPAVFCFYFSRFLRWALHARTHEEDKKDDKKDEKAKVKKKQRRPQQNRRDCH